MSGSISNHHHNQVFNLRGGANGMSIFERPAAMAADAEPAGAAAQPIAYIVDDDEEIGTALRLELSTFGYRCRWFPSAIEFLRCVRELEPACIVLDIRMPGKNGIEMLVELAQEDIRWPAIMMTGHGEIFTAVEAMKLGAIEFLEKPFSGEALLAALERGNAQLEASREAVNRANSVRTRYERLSGREQAVFEAMAGGVPTNALCERLAIKARTVEMHRANAMRKLEVGNLAEVLAIARELRVGPWA